MMSNSESRKREAERAAGELVADIDTLAAAIRRNNIGWLREYEARALAEALVAAGFGNVAAARREIAEAERRGVERALAGVMTHNESPVSPTNLRWAATHEALCRSFIFDVLTGLADALDNRAHQIGRDS